MPMAYTGVGSRRTPTDICAQMTVIALAMNKIGYRLRSGAAPGADWAFEMGAGDAADIYVPWTGFNNHVSRKVPTHEAFDMAARYHPVWERLSQGAMALHARNCHQVLGDDLASPSKLLICWTLRGKWVGGTATALKIASDWRIPIWNMGG